MSELVRLEAKSKVLLWIIRGIGEYLWINAPLNPVVACDDHSVYHGMNEVVVKHVLPDHLDEFALAMGHQLAPLGLPMWVPTGNPAFEQIWKL